MVMIYTFLGVLCVLCHFTCVWLCAPIWSGASRFFCLWNSPGENTGVHCHFLLQGIFPTQKSNPSLPHCRQILYQLSHQGNPRILGWVVYPFSSRSSPPNNWTRVSCIAGGFFTSWATKEPPYQRQWNSFHSPQLHTESASCLGNVHSLEDNLSDNLTSCLPEPCLQRHVTTKIHQVSYSHTLNLSLPDSFIPLKF